MKYTIANFQGHQYQMSEGDTLSVDQLTGKVGDKLNIDQVLLLVDGDQINIGQPFLADVSVTVEIIKHFRGDKIRVSKFKAKSRYRRVTGFRSEQTQIKVLSINTKEAVLKPKTVARKTKKVVTKE